MRVIEVTALPTTNEPRASFQANVFYLFVCYLNDLDAAFTGWRSLI